MCIIILFKQIYLLKKTFMYAYNIKLTKTSRNSNPLQRDLQ